MQYQRYDNILVCRICKSIVVVACGSHLRGAFRQPHINKDMILHCSDTAVETRSFNRQKFNGPDPVELRF